MNPIKALTCDTQKLMNLVEEEVFNAAEVAMAIKGIKSGKAAGEDEIKCEMLKVLTGEGIFWLTQVCQVAEFGQQDRIFRCLRKEIASNVRTAEGYQSLVCQGKYIICQMP